MAAAKEWHEAPTEKSARGFSSFRHRVTSATGNDSSPRCTPAAPAATATSNRSLIRIRVEGIGRGAEAVGGEEPHGEATAIEAAWVATSANAPRARDRKSTRLNSSHVAISYAVFCLKKKKKKNKKIMNTTTKE